MQNKAKIKKVMGEFKRGKLHSGSKSGPLVRDRDQAIAIALSEARRGYAEGGVARSEEAFQRWVRSLPWFKEFVGQYGEEPDLDTPDYDYRAAFRAGLTPTRHRDGTYHWPSSLDDGSLLKGPAHPTLYKEYFMRNSGVDPDDFGQLDPDVFATFVEPSRYAEGGLSRRGILGAIAGAAATAAAKKGKGLIDNAAPAAERTAARAATKVDVGDLLKGLRDTDDFDTRNELLDYLYRKAYGGDESFADIVRDYGGSEAVEQLHKTGVMRRIDEFEKGLSKAVPDPETTYWVARFNPNHRDSFSLHDNELDQIDRMLGYPRDDAMLAGKYKEIRPEHLLGDPRIAENLRNVTVDGKSMYDVIQDMLRTYYEDLYSSLPDNF